MEVSVGSGLVGARGEGCLGLQRVSEWGGRVRVKLYRRKSFLQQGWGQDRLRERERGTPEKRARWGQGDASSRAVT